MLTGVAGDVDRFWAITGNPIHKMFDGLYHRACRFAKPGACDVMDTGGLAEAFRENAVVWMLVFFVGILYWAFRGRSRRGEGRRVDPK